MFKMDSRLHGNDKQRGFTLIELAIVLVVIGLVIGGVMVGRDLIEGARVRSQASQIESFQAATNTFKLKYGGFPGDLTTEQATQFGFAPTTRSATSGGAGVTIVHGNGQLDGYLCVTPGPNNWSYCYATLISEHALFWRDLSSSRLIRESFTTAVDANPGSVAVAPYVPVSKIASNTYLLAYGFPYSYNYNGISARGGNYFHLSGVVVVYLNGRANTSGVGATLTPIQAYALDAKIDNGEPLTGSVLGGNSAEHPLNAAGGCTTGNLYTTASTPSLKTCQLSIRFN